MPPSPATAPVIAPRCPKHQPAQPKDCPRCRLHQATKKSVRDAARRAGTWERMVPVGPVAARCRRLHAAGLPYAQQAALAGLPAEHVRQIASRETGCVWPSTAAALLSVPPPSPVRAGAKANWVDATGTRRRLIGLAVNGWSLAALAPRLGVTFQAASKWVTRKWVLRRTADKVAALADELYGLTGPTRFRGTSTCWPRKLWIPLEMWGDDIDDPAAVPAKPDPKAIDEVKVERACTGSLPHTELTRDERTAAINRLFARGLNYGEIAVRMCWLDRHGKPAHGAVGAHRRRNCNGMDR